MRHELAKTAVAALAVAWVLCGCFDDPDGDLEPRDWGDDTDSETEDETETDTGSEGECGSIDALCCETEPRCADELTQVDESSGCHCHLPCAPAPCPDDLDLWGSTTVPCFDVSDGGGIGACFADEDLAPVDQCTTEICTTPSGYTDGICLFDGANDYCMRRCEPGEDTCDGSHVCGVALDVTDDLVVGVCLPN